MRRLALLALVLPVIAAAGCGGGDKSASGPLDEALRYLPKDSPFVAAIDTNVGGGQYTAAGDIAKKFTLGSQLESELKQLFEANGNLDFDRDVKPLLGNPFVVGAVDSKTFTSSGGNAYVAAIQVKDSDKLKELVKKDNAAEKGEKSGAKLYEDRSGNTFAVKDDVLIVAGSKKLLEDALERRDGDNSLTEDTFDSALAGLPTDSLVRSYFDLESLLKATPGGRNATKVKWVGALRTLGFVAQAHNDSLSIAFNLKTDPDGLTDKDLPVAAGDAAPKVLQGGSQLSLGLRDPGQIVDFGIDAAAALEGPSVDVGKRQLEHQLGINIQRDISDQLTGDMSVEVTPSGKFGVRSELKDPAAFKRTLAKIAPSLPSVAAGLGLGSAKLVKPKQGEDLYTLASANGTSFVFGVTHGVLVVTNEPAGARPLALATPKALSGAKGSVVMSADAEKLADALLKQLSAQLGPLLSIGGQFATGPLGDLTGSVETTTSGMKGSIDLKFD